MAKHAVSLLALLCVVVGAHAATLRGVATSVPVVETTLGPVQGTVVSSGSGSGSAAQWLGIPYAATTGATAVRRVSCGFHGADSRLLAIHSRRKPVHATPTSRPLWLHVRCLQLGTGVHRDG